MYIRGVVTSMYIIIIRSRMRSLVLGQITEMLKLFFVVLLLSASYSGCIKEYKSVRVVCNNLCPLCTNETQSQHGIDTEDISFDDSKVSVDLKLVYPYYLYHTI